MGVGVLGSRSGGRTRGDCLIMSLEVAFGKDMQGVGTQPSSPSCADRKMPGSRVLAFKRGRQRSRREGEGRRE